MAVVITNNQFRHASHPGHVLLWSRAGAERYECNLCREPGSGSRYACTSRRCSYHLHKECGDAPAEKTDELFPGCTLSLQPQPVGNPSRVCSVCGRAVRGISYRCSHRDVRRAHDAHPRCLAYPRVVTDDRGREMHLSSNAPSDCNRCGRRYVAGNVTGFSYVSTRNGDCYHVVCGGRRPVPTPTDGRQGNQVSSRTTPDGGRALRNTRVTPAPTVPRTEIWVTNYSTHIRSYGGTEITVVQENSGTAIRVQDASTSEALVWPNRGTGAAVRNNRRSEIPRISQPEINRRPALTDGRQGNQVSSHTHRSTSLSSTAAVRGFRVMVARTVHSSRNPR